MLPVSTHTHTKLAKFWFIKVRVRVRVRVCLPLECFLKPWISRISVFSFCFSSPASLLSASQVFVCVHSLIHCVLSYAPVWVLRKWEKIKGNKWSKELGKSLCFMGTSPKVVYMYLCMNAYPKVVCFLCCLVLCTCSVAEKMGESEGKLVRNLGNHCDPIIQNLWDHKFC